MIYVAPDDAPVNLYMGTRTVKPDDSENEIVYPIFGEVASNEIFLYFVDIDGARIDIGELEYESIRAARAVLLENRAEHERMASINDKTVNNKN